MPQISPFQPLLPEKDMNKIQKDFDKWKEFKVTDSYALENAYLLDKREVVEKSKVKLKCEQCKDTGKIYKPLTIALLGISIRIPRQKKCKCRRWLRINETKN